MAQCLKTILKETINNSKLMKVDEIRFSFKKLGNTNADNHKISISSKENTTLTILSGGYFTDDTMTQNLGTNLTVFRHTPTNIYITDGDVILSLSNKYDIFNLSLNNTGFNSDLRVFTGMSSLENLYLDNTFACGNISSLNSLYKLNRITANSCSLINGDISYLSSFTLLKYIGFNQTKLYGDISSFSSITTLESIYMNSTYITGNISALSSLIKLNTVSMVNTGVTGSKSSLSGLTNLTTVNFDGTKVTD